MVPVPTAGIAWVGNAIGRKIEEPVKAKPDPCPKAATGANEMD